MWGDQILQCLHFEVGSSCRIQFWHNCWCGDQPLKMIFPMQFETALDKDASMEYLLEIQEVGGKGRGWWWWWWWNWSVGFMRNFNDWEIDRVASFLHLLEYDIPSREGEDQMRWKLRSSGQFSVRSFYETLWGSSSMSFPWKAIWRVKALCGVSFLCGQQFWGKFLLLIIL